MPGEVTNLQNRLRELNPEAAARADELIAGGMEPAAAYAKAAQEYGVSPDAPAVSADFDTSIQPPPDPIQIPADILGEGPGVTQIPADIPGEGPGVTQIPADIPVEGPPVEATQPAGNGRSALLQALSAMGQRPAVEAPVVQPPDLKLSVLQALSKAGSGLLGLRDQSRTEKRNRASQATANVINALSKGRAGARGLQEEARPGLLTQLAAVPGQVAGAGLKFQADKQAAEQSEFANQLKARQLEFDEEGARSERLRAMAPLFKPGDLPTAGQNKVAMMEKGRDLFDAGQTRGEVRAALENDPDFKALVSANPQIATEMVGNALKGYDAREQGVFKREIDLAREERALAAEGRSKGAEGRAVIEFTDKKIDRLVRSYTRRLSGAVEMAGTRKGALMEDPVAFFEEHQLKDMIGGDDPTLALDLMSAYQEQVGAYAKARVEYWNDQREISRQKQRDTLANAKQKFGVTDTLRKSIMGLEGVKSFSGSQGLGPSFARMKRFHQDYRADPDMAGRAEAQVAMVNQFQRLIDPATVRSQDIELYRDALSTMANIEVALIRVGKGGFLPDDMIDGMMQVATSLHEAQRDFVESEVQSTIGLWDLLHPGFKIGEEEAVTISKGILGGERTDGKIETPREKAKRIREGG